MRNVKWPSAVSSSTPSPRKRLGTKKWNATVAVAVAVAVAGGNTWETKTAIIENHIV
jgi:hypothetical protein